jgi:hypothetical protein
MLCLQISEAEDASEDEADAGSAPEIVAGHDSQLLCEAHGVGLDPSRFAFSFPDSVEVDSGHLHGPSGGWDAAVGTGVRLLFGVPANPDSVVRGDNVVDCDPEVGKAFVQGPHERLQAFGAVRDSQAGDMNDRVVRADVIGRSEVATVDHLIEDPLHERCVSGAQIRRGRCVQSPVILSVSSRREGEGDDDVLVATRTTSRLERDVRF